MEIVNKYLLEILIMMEVLSLTTMITIMTRIQKLVPHFLISELPLVRRNAKDQPIVSEAVTEIVDGDTIDVNNVRIRLSMINTPENGEVGYDEAIKTTESVCQVGSSALVDEDDGQKEGSYDRLIGVYIAMTAPNH